MQVTGTVMVEISQEEANKIAASVLWGIIQTGTGYSDWVTDIVTDDKGNTYYGDDSEALVSTEPKIAAVADTINILTCGHTIKLTSSEIGQDDEDCPGDQNPTFCPKRNFNNCHCKR